MFHGLLTEMLKYMFINIYCITSFGFLNNLKLYPLTLHDRKLEGKWRPNHLVTQG